MFVVDVVVVVLVVAADFLLDFSCKNFEVGRKKRSERDEEAMMKANQSTQILMHI